MTLTQIEGQGHGGLEVTNHFNSSVIIDGILERTTVSPPNICIRGIFYIIASSGVKCL